MADQMPLMLRALSGETLNRPPVWFMRQAGRYLPEYRELRQKAPDFISFCLNPEMAAEATLQPMRRFSFDASIVFADILLIPKALGQQVEFISGRGPVLGALPDLRSMRDQTELAGEALAAVGETLQRVRDQLDADKTLIGFCGAPWTVATYMLGGGRAEARQHLYQRPETVLAMLDILVEASAHYLKMQVDNGAQVLQIFESWAEGLSNDLFETLVIRPNQALIERVRSLGVEVPIIGFPRGAAAFNASFIDQVPVQGLSLDTACPLELGQTLQRQVTVQGALDPMLLLVGGKRLDQRIDQLRAAWGQGPWIFNLGHGIDKHTPIAHVEQALKHIQAVP